MAVTEGVPERDHCWRRHALWSLWLFLTVAAIFVVVGGYFFFENQTRAKEIDATAKVSSDENAAQNLQIIVVQTQLEHIRLSLGRIEAKLDKEPKP